MLVKTDPNAEPAPPGHEPVPGREGRGLPHHEEAGEARLQGHRLGELVFEDYRVPAENLIGGDEGKGLQQILGGLELGRINVAARGVGVARAAWRTRCATRRCARPSASRSASTRPSRSSSPTWRPACEAARLLVENAARAYDTGERCDMEAGMAKLFATEAAVENSIEASLKSCKSVWPHLEKA